MKLMNMYTFNCKLTDIWNSYKLISIQDFFGSLNHKQWKWKKINRNLYPGNRFITDVKNIMIVEKLLA